jgi:ribosomal protein S18 acetylase RimI-like enzyme
VRSGTELLEFGKARFLAELDALIDVYTAAMHPPQQQLPGRRSIMERHAQFPSFRSVVMTLRDEPTRQPAGPRARTETGRYRVIGFAYGFHGMDGQWWHDLVRSALISVGGYGLAQTWLADSFEVAEVHVHPDYQGRGIGGFLLEQLEHLARVRGCTHLVLEVAENNQNALKFYRARSFHKLDAAIFLAKKVVVEEELLPPRRLKTPGAPRAPKPRPKRSTAPPPKLEKP